MIRTMAIVKLPQSCLCRALNGSCYSRVESNINIISHSIHLDKKLALKSLD